MATRTETLAVLGLLCAAYPNFELQDPTLELWVQEFREMPARHLESAARAHLRTSRYFPSIGEILPDAEAAWARETEDRQSRVLRLEPPRADPDDPAVREAREQLRRICGGIGKPIP